MIFFPLQIETLRPEGLAEGFFDVLGPETHQGQLASLHLQTLQYLQAKLGTGYCSSSTKGYEGPREVRGQEGRAWGSTSKFLIVFLEKEISYGHTIPYLTGRPLSPISSCGLGQK